MENVRSDSPQSRATLWLRKARSFVLHPSPGHRSFIHGSINRIPPSIHSSARPDNGGGGVVALSVHRRVARFA